MYNEEKDKVLIQTQKQFSNSLGNLETCQSFNDLKYSYFQLFLSIINIQPL